MGPFIKHFVEGICFTLLFLDLVCSDNDFEKLGMLIVLFATTCESYYPTTQSSGHRIHTPPRLPPGMIFIVAAVLMVAASLVILCCYWIRRQHSIQYTSPHIPPTLAPTVSPVTSGVRMQSSQRMHSLVPGAAQSPAASHPQPPYYQQPAVPYPQELPYMGNNTAPLVQPSAALYSTPSVPFDPPPPYVSPSIPPETHFRKS